MPLINTTRRRRRASGRRQRRTMPTMSVECKEAFRTQFGAARRHVSRTQHPRRRLAPHRRSRAVGIGRVVIAADGTGLRIHKVRSDATRRGPARVSSI